MDNAEFIKLMNRAKTTRRVAVSKSKRKAPTDWQLGRRTNKGKLSVFALMPSGEWKGWKGEKKGQRLFAAVELEAGDFLAVHTLTTEQAEAWRKHRLKPALLKWHKVDSSREVELHIPCELFPADLGIDLSLEPKLTEGMTLRFKVVGAGDASGDRATVNTGISQR